jgi:hypothetical protein
MKPNIHKPKPLFISFNSPKIADPLGKDDAKRPLEV